VCRRKKLRGDAGRGEGAGNYTTYSFIRWGVEEMALRNKKGDGTGRKKLISLPLK